MYNFTIGDYFFNLKNRFSCYTNTILFELNRSLIHKKLYKMAKSGKIEPDYFFSAQHEVELLANQVIEYIEDNKQNKKYTPYDMMVTCDFVNNKLAEIKKLRKVIKKNKYVPKEEYFKQEIKMRHQVVIQNSKNGLAESSKKFQKLLEESGIVFEEDIDLSNPTKTINMISEIYEKNPDNELFKDGFSFKNYSDADGIPINFSFDFVITDKETEEQDSNTYSDDEDKGYSPKKDKID